MKKMVILLSIAVIVMMAGLFLFYVTKPKSQEKPNLKKTLLNESLTSIDHENGKFTLIYQPGQNYYKNGFYHEYNLDFSSDLTHQYFYKVENKISSFFNIVADRPYRVESKGKYVELTLLGASQKDAVVGKNTLFFANVLSSIDREIIPIYDGIKESLILRNISAPTSFTYQVNTNLTASAENNTVTFSDGSTSIFMTDVPSVYDRNKKSFPYKVSLRSQGSEQFVDISITLKTDTSIAVYPVVIDPETRIWQQDTSDVKDATIENNTSKNNWGIQPGLDVQIYQTKKYRALIKYGVTYWIPAGSKIDSAKLDLYAAAVQGGSNSTSVYRVIKDWDEGDKWNVVGNCCWDSSKNNIHWDSTGGGGDYYGYRYANNTTTASGWHYYNLDTNLIKFWMSKPDSNFGMILRLDNESGSDHGPAYYSKNEATYKDRRPKLTITYTPPAPPVAAAIKYSSKYPSLQEAVDSTKEGETLIIDSSYTLSSTVKINRKDVTIIGTKSLIKPWSNGSPSPLIRVINDNSSYSSMSNIVLKNLQIYNQLAEQGYGIGNGIEIYEQSSTAGIVSHIKLEDLIVQNFENAIYVTNAHDVYIENCWVTGNHTGLRCESAGSGHVCGQIKLFGGYFINNRYHINLDGASGTSVGEIFLFGWTCGHQRNTSTGFIDTTGGSVGVHAGQSTGGIFSFGCHYEDLDYAIRVDNDFINGVTVLGNTMDNIHKKGIYIHGGANEVSAIGNTFEPDSVSILRTANVYNGILVGANSHYKIEPSDSISQNGFIESSASKFVVNDTLWKSSFRIPIIQYSHLPSVDSLYKGSMFFIPESNAIFINNGTQWKAIK